VLHCRIVCLKVNYSDTSEVLSQGLLRIDREDFELANGGTIFLDEIGETSEKLSGENASCFAIR